MSKTVHIVGAGGPAGIGITRCLREHYEVTGEDSSPWAELMMEVPGVGEHTDMTIYLPDSVVHMASFSPSYEQVDLCQDKARTAEVLGDLAPRTYWVRDTHGAGGSGAQMASEMLPGGNYSCEFVYRDGQILATFQKMRVSYSVKHRTEGLENRGSSAVSVCTSDATVQITASNALLRVADATGTKLNGFYGVDLKCDEDGVPKVTEINAGRLLTASYSFFWLTGYNLPLVGVRAFLGEELPVLPEYPLGYGIIRQADQPPRLFPPSATRSWGDI